MKVAVNYFLSNFQFRYCAYNIGDTSAASDLSSLRLAMGHTDSVLDDLIQKTRERQAGSLHEVTWRDRVIPIKTDKVASTHTVEHDVLHLILALL